MAGGVERPGLAEQARFALASCELVDGELVVTGAWSGVRGLRFVRPTLIVGDRSVLATLEHKPWDATSESWTAAFPWAGEAPGPEQLRISVAPQITVDLGADGTLVDAAAAPRFSRDRDAERDRARAAADRDDALVERDRARSELEEMRIAERAAAARVEAHRRDAEASAHAEQAAQRAREDAEARTAAAERERDDARRAAADERAARERAEEEARRLQAERDAVLRELERIRADAEAAATRAVSAEAKAGEASAAAVRARDALAAAAREIPMPEAPGLSDGPAPDAPAPLPLLARTAAPAWRRATSAELAESRALLPARVIAAVGIVAGFILLLKLIS